jgi:hypothetical protein
MAASLAAGVALGGEPSAVAPTIRGRELQPQVRERQIQIRELAPRRFGRNDLVNVDYAITGGVAKSQRAPLAHARVLLSGQDCEVLEVAPGSVTFRVPRVIEGRGNPDLALIVDSVKSEPFYSFALVPKTPAILSVGPPRVVAGRDAIAVTLADTIDPLGGPMVVLLGGVPIGSVRSGDTVLRFPVPSEVPSGNQAVVVQQPGADAVKAEATIQVAPFSWTIIYAGAAALSLAAAAIALWFVRRASRLQRTAWSFDPRADGRPQPPADVAGPDTTSPPPRAATAPPLDPPPPELREALAANACVLYVGEGLAERLGTPTRREVLEALRRLLPADAGSLVDGAIERAAWDAAFDVVRAQLPEAALREALASVTASLADAPATSQLVTAVTAPPFAGYVLDGAAGSLLQALEQRGVEITRSGSDRAAYPETLRGEKRFAVQLRGNVRDGPLLLTNGDLRRYFYENEPLTRFVAFVASSRTLLFVGASLATVEEVLQARPTERQGQPSLHFALVPWQEDLPLDAARLQSRFGVRVLSYGAPDQLLEFMAALQDGGARTSRPEARPVGAKLDGVRLTNIGAFPELDLPLTPQWNVLLGNNGCGKSTILRAIALGLCGDDRKAAELAAPLLRAGQDKGAIELRSGREVYRTEIFRDSRGVVVKSQVSPLQAGRWVVLGFPALRGVTTRAPSGPRDDAIRNPDVSDVLPLLEGAIDGRMDAVAQWVVNVDYRAAHKDRHAAAQRDAFFRTLAALTPGLEARFDSIEKNTWRVMVKTADGVVPLDRISQGTSSVFGWVGTLLRRMYEIYPDAEVPESRPAIVLVDELDAHMHPAWQRSIVPAIRELFPNTQAIATTHSPLIVGGLEREELIAVRREREDAAPVVERLPQSFEGWRADQILTSPAFELPTSVARNARAIDEYAAMLGKATRSADEDRRLAELEQAVQDGLPSYPETSHEREALELVKAALISRAAAAAGAGREDAVFAEARRLLAEAVRGPDASTVGGQDAGGAGPLRSKAPGSPR